MQAAVIAIAVIIASVFFLFKSGEVKAPVLPEVSFLAPAPTPFAFEEMTIPFLRKKEYKSQLEERVKYSKGSNYTSYLTSYDSDGLKINGLLTIPDAPGPHPAVVFVHGYIAPSIYKTTERYSDHVDYLAKNGFVVFKIDLRGHGQSQGDASGAYYSSDYIIDTLNAYSSLQNAEFVDPKRVGVWGHSMAGNVVLRSLAVKKDIPAAVIWAGAGFTYSDLVTYRIMDNSYRAPQQSTERARKRQLLRDTYGEFNPESDFWKKVVPTNYLDGVTSAILLNHAVNDDVVNIGYSRNLNEILDKTDIPHKLNEYPSGGHNITGTSFNTAMEATVNFFKDNLK